MWLIAGLGNPGKHYQHNRHNIGFMIIDELAQQADDTSFVNRHGGLLLKTSLKQQRVLLFKPMEYMNRSGSAITTLARFHNQTPDQIIVIHDELDFPLGKCRIKIGGGHGGHNGLRSIIQCLNSPDFCRIRVGIGKPTSQNGINNTQMVSNYVLSDFEKKDTETLQLMITLSVDAALKIMTHGVAEAMNQIHSKN